MNSHSKNLTVLAVSAFLAFNSVRACANFKRSKSKLNAVRMPTGSDMVCSEVRYLSGRNI